MKEFDADLHFHGPYSGGVSKNMLLPVIAEQAQLKGLHVVATADILHEKWFKHVKENLIEEENNVFKHKDFQTNFIIGTEVQCQDRVHHLIYLPDLSAAEELKEKFKGKGQMDAFGCGRPIIRLSAQEIAEKVIEANGMIGPAHAFTPYFSVYAHFDSVKKAYGSLASEIKFLELGLSADSYFADLIEENHDYVFLTNSDSHSPWPHRLGREFNRLVLKRPSFQELRKALGKEKERKIALNAGLDPREGKYHCTACNNCYAKHSLEQALTLKWKCSQCSGSIKKGVKDRILELSKFKAEIHPSFRPEYLHVLPLAEIIQLASEKKSIQSKAVQALWSEFIDLFHSEIKVLIDAPIIDLMQVNKAIAKKIEAFRKGLVLYVPGGGGQYGRPIICDSEQELEEKKIELKNELECQSSFNQKTLLEF